MSCPCNPVQIDKKRKEKVNTDCSFVLGALSELQMTSKQAAGVNVSDQTIRLH